MTPDAVGGERPNCDSVLPGEEGWDEARRPWNLAADQHPAAVAHPQTADDVIAAVRFARERGLRVAAQCTGHAAAELDTLADALLVRTAHLRELEIDPAARRARVGAGLSWGEVAVAAAAHGLAGPAGSSGTVGVVGYTLGGGNGWLGRRHGLACNGVHAVELVTADGQLRRVDADDPELFWALRGGGGNFGVVTAIEFALHPVLEVEAGFLLWPVERAPEVLPAWWGLTAGLPEEVSTIGRILNLPPLEELPPFLRGRELVVVEVADLRGPGELAGLLAPLRELDPEIDTVAPAPAPALGKLHMDPEDPVPATFDGGLLSGVTDGVLDAIVALMAPGSGSPLLSIELRQLGGALARPPAGAGAISHLDAEGLFFGVGISPGPEAVAAVRAGLEEMNDALAPWTSSRSLPNFAGRRRDPRDFYGDAGAERLAAARAAVDPDGMFQAPQPVGVTA
jgi:hypothetical protein